MMKLLLFTFYSESIHFTQILLHLIHHPQKIFVATSFLHANNFLNKNLIFISGTEFDVVFETQLKTKEFVSVADSEGKIQ